MVPGIDTKRIELRACTEAPGDVGETIFLNARTRQEKVRIVRSRPDGVFLIGALQPEVRIAQGIDALRPVLGAGQLRFEVRSNVGNSKDRPAREDRVHHVLRRARVVCGNCRPGRPVDTGRLGGRRHIGRLLAQSLLMARPCLRPEPIKDGTSLGIELLDSEDRDVAVLWIDPGGRPAGEATQTRQQRHRPHDRSFQHT